MIAIHRKCFYNRNTPNTGTLIEAADAYRNAYRNDACSCIISSLISRGKPEEKGQRFSSHGDIRPGTVCVLLCP